MGGAEVKRVRNCVWRSWAMHFVPSAVVGWYNSMLCVVTVLVGTVPLQMCYDDD